MAVMRPLPSQQPKSFIHTYAEHCTKDCEAVFRPAAKPVNLSFLSDLVPRKDGEECEVSTKTPKLALLHSCLNHS